MKLFKVVDVYGGRETLDYVGTIAEVKQLARQRILDTDGECLIEVRKLNEETGKYKFLKILETV